MELNTRIRAALTVAAEQAGCSLDEARARMQADSEASGVPLDILADCVLDGSIAYDGRT